MTGKIEFYLEQDIEDPVKFLGNDKQDERRIYITIDKKPMYVILSGHFKGLNRVSLRSVYGWFKKQENKK